MISVILPVYNGEKYLVDAIDSVLDQELESFELIIVNDCSKDDSKTILERYEDHDKVRIVHNAKNMGLFASLNKGIKEARGTFLKIWAQDDIMMPNCLDSFQLAFDSFPECSFIWSQSVIITNEKSVDLDISNSNTKPVSSESLELWDIQKSIRHFWWCGSLHGNISLFGFSKKIWTQLNGFNAELIYSGDIDFTERALRVAMPVCIPIATVWLRNHQDQLSKSTNHLHFELAENLTVFDQVKKQTEDRTDLMPFAKQCARDKIVPYRVSNALLVSSRNPIRGLQMLWSIQKEALPKVALFLWVRSKIYRKFWPKKIIRLNQGIN